MMRSPRYVLFSVCAILLFASSALAYDSCPIGYAAMNVMGQNGTTGGNGENVVVVSTFAELYDYAGRTDPYTILVAADMIGGGIVNVKSNKSIIGMGAGVTFNGINLDIKGYNNIIIRNLTMSNGYPDAISIREAHHIWVDHCFLSHSFDGLLDSGSGSDYITISNVHFYDHDKDSLVGSGTNHFEDVGHNHVTYHHCWFDTCIQRNPLCAYGPVHVFNNYYTNTGIGGYTVGYRSGAKVRVENCYFLSANNPLNQSYSSVPTDLRYADGQSIGSIFVSCTGSTTGTGISFDPTIFYDYTFALDAAADIPTLVQAQAGPQSGCDYILVPVPGNSSIDNTTASPQLSWSNVAGVTSWDIYFGTTTSPDHQTTRAERTWSPGTLAADTTYYWRVDGSGSSTVTGQLWRFHTAPAAATKPYPADGQTNAPRRVPNDFYTVKPMELSWTKGFGVSSQSLYMGTSSSLTGADLKGTPPGSTFAPGLLKSATTYYWRVDTVGDSNAVTTGTVWSFTTNPIVNAPIGRTEAESMVLNARYYLMQMGGWSGGWGVWNDAGPGVLCAYYSGTSAICDITTTYEDADGVARYYVLVNNVQVDQWDASVNSGALVTHVTRTQLNLGDEICIQTYTGDPDWARVDCMNIAVAAGADDTYPPSPSPMTWAVAPAGTDYDSITMTASTATDPAGVQYLFTCTSGAGGHSSAWQDSPTYVDSGLPASLTPSVDFTYTVKARDKSANNNQTLASEPASARTTALTTSLIRINFQPAPPSRPIAGYLSDYGDVYSLKSCGLSYGWNVAANTFERNANTDKRLDTGVHFHMGGSWEIELPNGAYDVTAATGDTTSSICNLYVEGFNYWSFVSMNANAWSTKTKTVLVSDGRLTIDNGAGGEEASTKLCYVTITLKTTADTAAPEPSPMTFSAAPRVLSNSAITMTASPAFDASGVEYMFICTSGTGGHSSSWQSSRTYTDTGLNPSTAYGYRVKAHDLSATLNETTLSTTSSATTLAAEDTTPPTPNPMKWSVAPHAVSSSKIIMTAATATDATGVEYNFTCVSGSGGHSSGWQTSASYSDTGLTSGTTYTYTVTTRDRGTNQNTGTASPAASAVAGSLLTPLVKINFQSSAFASTPAGYVADIGSTYANRGNGFSYGWPNNHTDTMRDYGETDDPRLNTIVNFKASLDYWELGVTNGMYDVEATIGDGMYNRSGYFLNVEGVNYWSNTNLLLKQFLTDTKTVSVSDGRLRIDNSGSGDSDTRLCYVIVTQLTAADSTSPTPATMTWATAPYAVTSSSISMTATTASDTSGVQYYFACTTDPGHDSGWQSSSTYVATGLTNNASYTFTVKARDNSVNRNENTVSAPASATTPLFSCTVMASDKNANCQVEFTDFAMEAATWAGNEADWASLKQFADEWLVCNKAPSDLCWQ
jgi:pectate lyase